ncbi:Sec7-domain-containing protein [Aureobasidium subglaciale]|nr:Sec7-domain-containing protein [Aureobasidium subglaciale]KAI5231198.1 Sec7-domain-containing protein [Aureobasidium subglaciale]KAI5234045.1 Sec7-domain-containing protein [Aureobasidium subglaciale]KAI5267601.1 Sec7-domain-containing protein [Aureobasidium subglaciale]
MRRRRQLMLRLALIGSLLLAAIFLFFPSTRQAVLPALSLGLFSGSQQLQLETVRYYDLANVQGTARGWEREERILLCAPLRDASPHLPMFFSHLRNLTYPHHLIDLAFLVGDSKDNTLTLLSDLLANLQASEKDGMPFGEVSVIEKDFGQKVNQDVESRHGFAAQASRRKSMAQARNWLLSAALRPTHSWVYWRDVDVETAPFTILEDLMRHNKDVIVPNVWRPLPDWLGGEQPYDLNSWQESETALALADTLDEDAVIVEGYAEYATWRPHLAYLRDPYGDPDMEMEIDGVGGVSILAKAKVFRSGVHFPAFSFEKHAETEGFGKMAKRMQYSVVGLPHYTIWHLYEPSLDDIRHMEEMEKERKAHEEEELKNKERMDKIQSQFDDTASEWEKDKSEIDDAQKAADAAKKVVGGVKDAAGNVKEAAGSVKDKVKQVAGEAKVAAKDAAGAVKDNAKGLVDKAEEVAGAAVKDTMSSGTGADEGHSSRASTMTAADYTIASRPVNVAIDPVALIITECITVTSAMRKHARWAQSSVSAILGGGAARRPPSSLGPLSVGDDADGGQLATRWGLRGKKGKSIQDNPLLSAFARLRSQLKGYIRTVDTPSILQPFLQVIRSSSTTAPITSLALIAITKMLSYNVISPGMPNFPYAMMLLSSSVTNCRFEGDNTASDDVVFLRILKLMEIIITGPSGDVLGDQSVCGMMECGISICCALRMSEVLRRSAEITMVTMCQTIFQRLTHLESLPEDDNQNDFKIESSTTQIGSTPAQDTPPSGSLDVPRVAGSERPSAEFNASQVDLTRVTEATDIPDINPYGLPSIRELFRTLAELLDPHDRQYTDTMRVMALRIVNVALEVAGPSIAYHPSLASLAKDTLCRNLFQLVRSENIALLHESLRVAGTLLATCRSVLRLQQELYLSYIVACLHPRVPIPDEPSINPALYEGVPQAPRLVKPAASATQSGRSTPVPVKDRQKLGMEGGSRKPDAREAMVESVGALVRIPSFMAELFVNYDCEIDRSDLCLDMVGLLSRNAFPDSATWSTTNVPPLCLDSLLGYVQFIADRLDDEPMTEGLPRLEALREQRTRKQIIIRGAAKFNENPKSGLAFLASQGVIETMEDSMSITRFLKGTSRIDKKVLGEFISKRSNEVILDAFLDLFDFTGQRVDEALRQILNSFRLPGESQLIERIVTVFAGKYCDKTNPEGIADKDAVYVLTYAIIMLNTDQHNPNMKQARMAVTDFARNLRGVNGGKDFEPEYLQGIYDSIKTREIILPEEHDNKHAFEHAWKELLIKTQTAQDLVLCDTNIYDADMFAATWKPVVATLNYVFMSATDDTVFQRVISGFDQCAQIAAKHGLHDCLDHIISSLAQISTLATETPPSTALNTEVQANGKSIMVSKFAVDFGRENKAQLATLVLFRIINGHEATIREGWSPIIRIILNLFTNSLIPTTLSTLTSKLDLPPIPLQSPAQVIERNDKSTDIGLFSAFTSYVSSVMNDEPPEPNDQEIESTLCTVDCISACRLNEVVANIGNMPIDALKAFTQSLLLYLPPDDIESSPKVIVVKSPVVAPTPVRANGQKPQPVTPDYDPGLVCILELATVLAMRDQASVSSFGQEVAQSLKSLLKPEVYQMDPAGMGEMRVQTAQLLCKIFLHYLVMLSEWEGMHDLWMEILDLMDRLMNSGQGNTLAEAVPESLKNVLLVMSSSGYLKPPSDDDEQSEQQKQLWKDTSDRLQSFLPELMPELFPEPEPKVVKEVGTKVADENETGAPVPVIEEKSSDVA